MGLIFSRFKKKKSPLELLEEIEEEINSIEEDKQSMMMRQKKYIGRLVIYSIIVYVIVAAIFYFSVFYGYKSLRDGMLYTLPLVIIPIIVLLAKKGLNYFFSQSMIKNKQKLTDLRGRKKKILDEVMEKETFKVAKDILEKFAPDQLGKNQAVGANGMEGSRLTALSLKMSPSRQTTVKNEEKPTSTDSSTLPPKPALVQTGDPGILNPSPPRTELPLSSQSLVRRVSASQSTSLSPMAQPRTSHLLQPSTTMKRRLIRPLPPPQLASRSLMERLIESLIGDGPSGRYALICSNCSSHNGMALKEEFEYISFRCAYCGFPNPSRKDKPRKSSLNLMKPRGESGDADSTDQESKDAEDSHISDDSNVTGQSEHNNSEVSQPDKEAETAVQQPV